MAHAKKARLVPLTDHEVRTLAAQGAENRQTLVGHVSLGLKRPMRDSRGLL
jgi:hypothetical protein